MPKGQPNKRYTPEFKIKVVETMHRKTLTSMQEVHTGLLKSPIR